MRLHFGEMFLQYFMFVSCRQFWSLFSLYIYFMSSLNRCPLHGYCKLNHTETQEKNIEAIEAKQQRNKMKKKKTGGFSTQYLLKICDIFRKVVGFFPAGFRERSLAHWNRVYAVRMQRFSLFLSFGWILFIVLGSIYHRESNFWFMSYFDINFFAVYMRLNVQLCTYLLFFSVVHCFRLMHLSLVALRIKTHINIRNMYIVLCLRFIFYV